MSINGAGYATMTVTYRTSFLSSVTLSTVGSCSKRPVSTPTITPTFTPSPTPTSTNIPVSPKLTATGSCTGDTANATFTITNSGGDMTAPYTYNIKDSAGNVVKTGTIQLKAGESTSVSTSGNYGVLTLSITDDKGTTTDAAMTTCTKSPKLTATGVCTGGTADATFTITNSGGDMTAPYTYTIKDSAGNVVKNGTFTLAAGDSVTVTASGVYGVLTLSITDDKGTTTNAATTTCVKPPQLTAIGICTENTAQATFVITNSGGNMTAPYTYNVKDNAGNVVATNTFQLKAGESVTVTTSGVYGVLTLSITDDKGTTTDAAMTTCTKLPKVTATGICTGDSATFVIANTGGDMTAAYTYEVKDDTGKVVKADTFQLKSGESVTLDKIGGTGKLTLFITDDKGNTTEAASTTCAKVLGTAPKPTTPNLTATGVCADNTGLATFAINNSGSDMPKPYTYTVKDSAGNVVKTDTFQLKAGESLTVNTSGVYGVLTLSITDDKGTTTDAAMTTCAQLPKLTAVGTCVDDTGLATFIITNNGSDMTKPYTYTVKDDAGNAVKTSTFQLKAGESLTVTSSGTYGVLTLSITDDKGTTTDAATTTCVKSPQLTASGSCVVNTGLATFVITNNGGDMPKPYTYNIMDSAGSVVKTGTIQLKAGESVSVSASGVDGVLTLSITDDKGTTTDAAMTTCSKLPNLTAVGTCVSNTTQATFTIINSGNDMSATYTYQVTDNTGKVVKTDTFQLKAGERLSIMVGTDFGIPLTLSIIDDKGIASKVTMTTCNKSTKEASSVPAVAPAKSEPCIQCLIFHTFRDDNLEIYRLDGIEGQPGFELFNLSKNGAVDSRPSRAPNDSGYCLPKQPQRQCRTVHHRPVRQRRSGAVNQHPIQQHHADVRT